MANKKTNIVAENVFSTADVDRLALAVSTITDCQNRAEGIAQTIASELFVVSSKKLYELDDCKSVAEWAGNRFGISKGTVSDAITTFQRFGDGTTGKLLEKWEGYNYSTLMKMKKLSDEQIEAAGIMPTMSRKQVMEAIEALKVLEDKQKELPRLEKEWAETYADLSKVMEVEDRMKLIQDIVPEFYNKDHVNTPTEYEDLISAVRSEIEARSTVEQEEQDGNEESYEDEAMDTYEARIDEQVSAQDENVDEEELHTYPQNELNINYYRRENGSLDKKALLNDIWELIQGVENNEYDIIITKAELPVEV